MTNEFWIRCVKTSRQWASLSGLAPPLLLDPPSIPHWGLTTQYTLIRNCLKPN